MKRIYLQKIKFIIILFALLAICSKISATGNDLNSPFEKNSEYKVKNNIDKLVINKLKKYHITPAKISSDAVFLRRVYLDVIGTLPTQQEITKFLSDKKPDKRSKVINALLKRKEFADYLSLKWGDLLRVKAEFPINLWPNGAWTWSTQQKAG